jgi:hypothetical protein
LGRRFSLKIPYILGIKLVYSGNTMVKIVEPNKGKHIAASSDINTIVASKDVLSKLRFFPEEGPLHTSKVDKKRIEDKPRDLVL